MSDRLKRAILKITADFPSNMGDDCDCLPLEDLDLTELQNRCRSDEGDLWSFSAPFETFCNPDSCTGTCYLNFKCVQTVERTPFSNKEGKKYVELWREGPFEGACSGNP